MELQRISLNGEQSPMLLNFKPPISFSSKTITLYFDSKTRNEVHFSKSRIPTHLELFCTYHDEGDILFTWFKDGAALKKTANLKIVSSSHSSFVLIENPRAETSGDYTCQAHNTAGPHIATVILVIDCECSATSEYKLCPFLTDFKSMNYQSVYQPNVLGHSPLRPENVFSRYVKRISMSRCEQVRSSSFLQMSPHADSDFSSPPISDMSVKQKASIPFQNSSFKAAERKFSHPSLYHTTNPLYQNWSRGAPLRVATTNDIIGIYAHQSVNLDNSNNPDTQSISKDDKIESHLFVSIAVPALCPNISERNQTRSLDRLELLETEHAVTEQDLSKSTGRMVESCLQSTLTEVPASSRPTSPAHEPGLRVIYSPVNISSTQKQESGMTLLYDFTDTKLDNSCEESASAHQNHLDNLALEPKTTSDKESSLPKQEPQTTIKQKLTNFLSNIRRQSIGLRSSSRSRNNDTSDTEPISALYTNHVPRNFAFPKAELDDNLSEFKLKNGKMSDAENCAPPIIASGAVSSESQISFNHDDGISAQEQCLTPEENEAVRANLADVDRIEPISRDQVQAVPIRSSGSLVNDAANIAALSEKKPVDSVSEDVSLLHVQTDLVIVPRNSSRGTDLPTVNGAETVASVNQTNEQQSPGTLKNEQECLQNNVAHDMIQNHSTVPIRNIFESLQETKPSTMNSSSPVKEDSNALVVTSSSYFFCEPPKSNFLLFSSTELLNIVSSNANEPLLNQSKNSEHSNKVSYGLPNIRNSLEAYELHDTNLLRKNIEFCKQSEKEYMSKTDRDSCSEISGTSGDLDETIQESEEDFSQSVSEKMPSLNQNFHNSACKESTAPPALQQILEKVTPRRNTSSITEHDIQKPIIAFSGSRLSSSSSRSTLNDSAYISSSVSTENSSRPTSLLATNNGIHTAQTGNSSAIFFDKLRQSTSSNMHQFFLEEKNQDNQPFVRSPTRNVKTGDFNHKTNYSHFSTDTAELRPTSEMQDSNNSTIMPISLTLLSENPCLRKEDNPNMLNSTLPSALPKKTDISKPHAISLDQNHRMHSFDGKSITKIKDSRKGRSFDSTGMEIKPRTIDETKQMKRNLTNDSDAKSVLQRRVGKPTKSPDFASKSQLKSNNKVIDESSNSSNENESKLKLNSPGCASAAQPQVPNRGSHLVHNRELRSGNSSYSVVNRTTVGEKKPISPLTNFFPKSASPDAQKSPLSDMPSSRLNNRTLMKNKSPGSPHGETQIYFPHSPPTTNGNSKKDQLQFSDAVQTSRKNTRILETEFDELIRSIQNPKDDCGNDSGATNHVSPSTQPENAASTLIQNKMSAVTETKSIPTDAKLISSPFDGRTRSSLHNSKDLFFLPLDGCRKQSAESSADTPLTNSSNISTVKPGSEKNNFFRSPVTPTPGSILLKRSEHNSPYNATFSNDIFVKDVTPSPTSDGAVSQGGESINGTESPFGSLGPSNKRIRRSCNISKRPKTTAPSIEVIHELTVKQIPATMKTVNPTDNLLFREVVGTGKFGKVFLCEDKWTGMTLAAKIIDSRRLERHKDGDIMEVAILRAIGSHESIAGLHSAYELNNKCYIITEYAAGGALYDRVVEEDNLDEKMSASIIYNMMLGLQHIQRCSILHLDLKPENVMMISPTGYRLKIIDFGLAYFFDPLKPKKRTGGTFTYSAPETINYESQDFSTDLWSVAVMAYELLAGITPFEIPQSGDPSRELSMAEVTTNIISCKYNFNDEGICDATEMAKEFIRMILKKNKSDRPSIDECLKHPWLQDSQDLPRVRRKVSLRRRNSALAKLGQSKEMQCHSQLA